MGNAYKLKEFYGDLPLHEKGINVGRLDRQRISDKYQFTIKDISKAYWNWQEVFRLKGSDLTFQQYLDKLVEAGISPSMVGNQSHQYNLSRYGDQGVYTVDNCRFITRLENLKEQKH